MRIYIYHLLDEVGNIRYVGKTKEPRTRLVSHCRGEGRGHVGNWIRCLLRRGVFPKMVIVQETTRWGWREAERAEIRRQRERGARLCNIRAGGDDIDIRDLRRQVVGRFFSRRMPPFNLKDDPSPEPHYLTPKFLRRYRHELEAALKERRRGRKC